MLLLTKTAFYFTFFNTLVQIQSLFDLPAHQDNDIVETETGVRNTLNKLFSTLKLEDSLKPKWKKFIKIHDYFFSVTVQDYDNLKEISRLVQVNNIDNSIQIFITQINEVLSKDNKSDETTDAVYITLLIQTFLEGLEHLKETYGVKSNVTNFDINETIIKILDSDETFDNATSDCEINESQTDVTNVSEDPHFILNETQTNVTNVTEDPEVWVEPEQSGRRIYKGKRASIKQYPFIVSIQFFNKFSCAGSLIKTDLIITSASCLQLAHNNRLYRENTAFLSVMIGSRFFEIGRETLPVMELYFHPNYNPKTLKHNLALIRLLRHVKLGKTNKRVKRITYDRHASPLPSNVEGITIVGWGARESGNVVENPWNNRLSYAVLDFYPLDECQEVYTKEFVTERNFCAGFFSKGGGACNHDAGGPGIMNSILVGVVSFGSPMCGAADAPTVFTKLGYYAPWIDEIMGQKIIHQRMRTTTRAPRTFAVPEHLYDTTPVKIKPVTTTTEPSDVEEPAELPPIKEIDNIRTLDQKERFDNFLKTIFENNLLDELSGTDCETEAIDEHKHKSKLKPDSHLSKIDPEIKSVTTRLPTTQLIDINETEEPEKYTRVEPLIEDTPKQSINKLEAPKLANLAKSEEIKPTDKELEKVVARLVSQIKEEESLKLRKSKKHKKILPADSEDYESEDGTVKNTARGVNDTVRELLRLVKKINHNEEENDGGSDNKIKQHDESLKLNKREDANNKNIYIKETFMPDGETDVEGDEYENTGQYKESVDRINVKELESYKGVDKHQTVYQKKNEIVDINKDESNNQNKGDMEEDDDASDIKDKRNGGNKNNNVAGDDDEEEANDGAESIKAKELESYIGHDKHKEIYQQKTEIIDINEDESNIQGEGDNDKIGEDNEVYYKDISNDNAKNINGADNDDEDEASNGAQQIAKGVGNNKNHKTKADNLRFDFESDAVETTKDVGAKKQSLAAKVKENSNDEDEEQVNVSKDERANVKSFGKLEPEITIDRERSDGENEDDYEGLSAQEDNNTEKLVELMSKSEVVYELLSKVVEEH